MNTILFYYIQTHNTETVTIYTQKATDFDVMYHDLTQHLASKTVLASKTQEKKEQYPLVHKREITYRTNFVILSICTCYHILQTL